MKEYCKKILECFNDRVVFMGIQGSYARNEASEQSDIDPVLILDYLNADDLEQYSSVIKSLPNSNKICGFIGGRKQVENWSRYDIFQLCADTVEIYGSLKNITGKITTGDAISALLYQACNIYHICAHNFISEKSIHTLKYTYKLVFYALQAKKYIETGNIFKTQKKKEKKK